MLRFMRAYFWQGVTRSGKRRFGVQIGDSLSFARLQLMRQGVIATRLRSIFWLTYVTDDITPKDIASFSRQLAYLLQAGFALVPAIDCLLQHYPSHSLMQRLLSHLKLALEDGMAFHTALRQYPRYFNVLYCRLIEISEQCGNLSEQLLQLADHQEKLLAIKQSVYKALYYPMSLLGISLVMLTLLVLWVVPQFEEMFSTVGVPLPYLTRILINIAHQFQSYGWLVSVGVGSLAGCGVIFYQKLSQWMSPWNECILKLPWIGAILKQTIIARFTHTLRTTLAAGLPLVDALTATIEIIPYAGYRKALIDVQKSLVTGVSLDQALAATRYFPPLLIHMIATGQLSGQLEKNLAQLSSLLDTQVNESVTRMISLLEPSLLLILGIIIGTVVFALYWPIFELGNVVGII